jgi:hypothetical protein
LTKFRIRSLSLSIWGASFAITELTSVKDADFHHFAHLLSSKQKKPASEETGWMNRLPCILLQDVGGTTPHTLLPAPRPVPLGYRYPMRGINYRD